MKRVFKILLAVLICGSSVLSLSGCNTADTKNNPNGDEPVISSDVQTKDTPTTDTQTKDTTTTPESYVNDREKINYGINSFSAELFKNEYEKRTDKNENVFLSPLSVYTALSVLDNGANGDTQSELNALLGGILLDGKSSGNPVNPDILNLYFKNYLNNLGDESTKLNMSNAVWVMNHDDVILNDVFKNNVSDFYSAEIFREDADKAVGSINKWVYKNTDKMIKEILKDGDLTTNTVAVLLNAIAFDGKWEKEYEKDNVKENTFHNYDGSTSDVEFMYSDENLYFSDDKAKGFIKNYESDGEKRYSFVAVLPDENIGIDEYVSKYFTYTTIKDYVNNASSVEVQTSLPKFSFDTSYKLVETLNSMGMKTAFDGEKADFTNFATATEHIYVNRVIHNAHIEVDEKGTKAAAVTLIDMYNEADAVMEFNEVYLDRPFLFAIYDNQEQVPVFIGTVMNEG